MPISARVAILMTDAGGGHRSAADALAECMQDRAQVSILNLLDDWMPFPFNRLSTYYGPCVTYAPRFYHFAYRSTAFRPRVTFAERLCYPLVRTSIRQALADIQPDLVLSVHPLLNHLPLRVLDSLGRRVPFVTVVTDPVTVHPAWFWPGVDLCIVATEEAKALALASGVAPSRVKVIGLPIRPAFTRPRTTSKPAMRAELGLDPERRLILFTGGGAGIGKLLPLAQTVAHRLAKQPTPVQMAIIAGRNRQLLARLRAHPWPLPVTLLGYTTHMADWLYASDILVTKAGPGTLAEAASLSVPVVITGFIPGQEAGNIAWIERHGAGAFVENSERVAELLCEWLEPGNCKLAVMTERARSFARPEATEKIVEAALELLQPVTREQIRHPIQLEPDRDFQ